MRRVLQANVLRFLLCQILIIFVATATLAGAAFAGAQEDVAALEVKLGVHKKTGSPADCRAAEKMCQDALAIIKNGGRRRDADALFVKALRLCPNSGQAWHGVGRWLRMMNRIPETLVAFHRAVQLDPELTGAWWSIGTTNAGEVGNQVLANEAFRRVTKTHPKDVGGMVLIGQAYARLHDDKGAEAALKRAAAAFPKEPGPWTDLASHYLQRGNRMAAEEAYGKAMQLDPKSIDGLSYIAAKQFSSGDLKGAEFTLKCILKQNPNRSGTWATLAAVMHEQGQDAEELKCSKQSYNADPGSGAACIAIVKAELHNHDLKAAEQYAKKMMTIGSGGDKAWSALAELREAENKPEEAEAAYKRACSLAPQDVHKWYSLAMFHMKQRNWKEAESELRTCAALPPPAMPQTYQALGLVLEKEGDLAGAKAALEAALKEHRRNVPSYIALSRVLMQLSQTTQAIEMAKKATKFGPTNPSTWYTLGTMLKEAGRFQEAESAYRTALKVKSTDSAIWNDLGTLLVHEHKPHEAEKCFRKAIAVQPDFSKAWSNLGQLLKAQGDKAGALKALSQALKTNADPGDAYQMAFSLEGLGDRKQANEAYRLGLNMTPEEADVLLNVPLVLDGKANPGDAAGAKPAVPASKP